VAADCERLDDPQRTGTHRRHRSHPRGRQGWATTLVVGVQSKTGDLQEVERYAKHAIKNGADAIVSLPPPGVADEKLLLEYYQKVGRMTELPLIVQTQENMSVDLVVQIFKTVPNFRHVKDEANIGGGALQRITEIRKRTNDEVKVFSGQGVRTMITEMELGFLRSLSHRGPGGCVRSRV